MRIETNNIVIRDFERKDAENLYRIVREKQIYRFMPDWTDNGGSPEEYYNYIDWHQTQKNSIDIYENKRYVIAIKHSDEMIGMVGMGIEEALNEVEVAYFMSEQYQRKGYTIEAVNALVDWCFRVSDIKYLILTIDCSNIPSNNLQKSVDLSFLKKELL